VTGSLLVIRCSGRNYSAAGAARYHSGWLARLRWIYR
jgi:hypothetical protein